LQVRVLPDALPDRVTIPMNITLTQVKEYVSKLPPEVQTIYNLADRYLISTRDTLDPGWQLAAEISHLFWVKTIQANEQVE
jgi:hypothetical protein